MTLSKVVPLAVIGCGAISESYYFPALSAMPLLKAEIWLVEPDRDRGQQSVARWGFDPGKLVGSIDEIPGDVRGAINATPSHLHSANHERAHRPWYRRCSSRSRWRRTPPMRRPWSMRRKGRCILTVNQFRRLWPSYRRVAQMLQDGDIGTVTQVTWAEGRKFEWPVRTGFMFRRPWTGRPRGALLDMGVHLLDTVCWWLGERPTVQEARMDGLGGPEAFVSAVLSAGQARIDMTVSFLAKLSNQYLIEGTAGAIRGATSDYSRFERRSGDGTWKTVVAEPADRVSVARSIIENFVAAILGEAPVLITPSSAVQPLLVIDEMYRKATDLVPACYREWIAEPAS